jgi:serine/threonine-protein kinase HipA
MRSTIEIYRDGRWTAAAEFDPIGRGPYTATFEYRMDYAFSDDPLPISLALPVTAERQGLTADGEAPPCPTFLLDLVPQGRGRQYLMRELKIEDGEAQDLRLAQYGAFNPIGNLRLDTAVQFFRERKTLPGEDRTGGFALDDILSRQDEFLEYIWVHAMLSAGTTGVQGAAPKFLLTEDRDGRWFADSALPDDRAARHWLVKLPRGSHETDYAVLHNEAAYLRVAEHCGLRAGAAPQLHGDMLFLQRFDRAVDGAGLHRLHQESLASLAGMRGFGLPASLFDLAAAFRPHVADPVGETVEFIRRDILNMAMRNTDNHARNTAVQRLPNGRVQLTPVFDFAPMYLDREFIVRGCRWRIGAGAELEAWDQIIDNLGFDGADRAVIAREVKAFQPVVERLAGIMHQCDVSARIIEDCRPTIAAQVARLDRLAPNKAERAEEPDDGPTP